MTLSLMFNPYSAFHILPPFSKQHRGVPPPALCCLQLKQQSCCATVLFAVKVIYSCTKLVVCAAPLPVRTQYLLQEHFN